MPCAPPLGSAHTGAQRGQNRGTKSRYEFSFLPRALELLGLSHGWEAISSRRKPINSSRHCWKHIEQTLGMENAQGSRLQFTWGLLFCCRLKRFSSATHSKRSSSPEFGLDVLHLPHTGMEIPSSIASCGCQRRPGESSAWLCLPCELNRARALFIPSPESRYLKDVLMCCLGTWFSDGLNVGLMVELHDLKGFLNLSDSRIRCFSTV